MRADSIREWREQYARCCLAVDFEPSAGTTFGASIKPIFPELRTARAALSAGFLFRDSVGVAVGAFYGVDVVGALRILECRVHGLNVEAAI